jgi:hypothetical protein
MITQIHLFVTEVEGIFNGDRCPCCAKGKVYKGKSRKSIEFQGNPPIGAIRHEYKTLRCNLCKKEFTAQGRKAKWQPSAKSSIILLKTLGFPYYRLSKLQSMYNTPVADSTAWKQVEDVYESVGHIIYEALVDEVAQKSDTYYMDDTGAKILEVIENNKLLKEGQRASACHTSVIHTTTREKNEIVLYITSDRHCGENIGEILEKKTNKKSEIRIMSDASSMNNPVLSNPINNKIIPINCLAHAIIKFDEIKDFFPKECEAILKEFTHIYDNEHYCIDNKLSSKGRLKYHKNHSQQHIANIDKIIKDAFDNKLVEPNSTLGKVMKYWLNHHEELTMFIRIRGVSLDNNSSERLVKIIIVQRKNSMFNATLRSAEIHSAICSIVQTAQVNGVNSFEYLNWIQDNEVALKKNAKAFLPWNTKQDLNNTELIAA